MDPVEAENAEEAELENWVLKCPSKRHDCRQNQTDGPRQNDENREEEEDNVMKNKERQ